MGRKSTITPEAIQTEINGRIEAAGHQFTVGLPRPVLQVFTTGRNWEPNVPAGLSTREVDVALTIAREVGNEFDCDWPPRAR